MAGPAMAAATPATTQALKWDPASDAAWPLAPRFPNCRPGYNYLPFSSFLGGVGDGAPPPYMCRSWAASCAPGLPSACWERAACWSPFCGHRRTERRSERGWYVERNASCGTALPFQARIGDLSPRLLLLLRWL